MGGGPAEDRVTGGRVDAGHEERRPGGGGLSCRAELRGQPTLHLGRRARVGEETPAPQAPSSPACSRQMLAGPGCHHTGPAGIPGLGTQRMALAAGVQVPRRPPIKDG